MKTHANTYTQTSLINKMDKRAAKEVIDRNKILSIDKWKNKSFK